MTGYLPPDPTWIEAKTSEAWLHDGTRVLIRPITADDKQRLEEGLQQLSPESRYRRFLHYVDRLSSGELRYLTEIDYHDHFAWLAMAADQAGHPGLGVARYIRDGSDPDTAEAAVAVIDRYQGKGLGTLLLTKLAATAREHGIERFVAYMAPANPAVYHLIHAVAATVTDEDGLLRVEIPIGEDEPGEGNASILRAVARGQLTVNPVREGRGSALRSGGRPAD